MVTNVYMLLLRSLFLKFQGAKNLAANGPGFGAGMKLATVCPQPLLIGNIFLKLRTKAQLQYLSGVCRVHTSAWHCT